MKVTLCCFLLLALQITSWESAVLATRSFPPSDTMSNPAEITLLDNNVIIYKFVQDLHFFVTGGDHENEIILASVLQGFFDAVTLLLRNNVDKREALENLDLILLCLDEIVDGGMILETNGPLIAEKVTSHSMDGESPLTEQTLSQAWTTAREHLTRTLLK
ncbi:hypothetical protein LR48_Vigan05g200800 [Vigna angularis]|uniref:Coatomer subunit zeta n=1 Tax=Phaseolus angularis TaxID=3914 RepID=A0A0L9UNT1_PHAAN|nr:hypothetical protein LR48_Vigan05g200800 [Vigna angularis]